MRILTGSMLAAIFATSALAQSGYGPTQSTGTAGGQTYTKTSNTYTNGSGTTTTTTVSPGNNSSVQPYVGGTKNDPQPNRERSSGSVHAGVTVPCCGD